jgi:hypothetical protein
MWFSGACTESIYTLYTIHHTAKDQKQHYLGYRLADQHLTDQWMSALLTSLIHLSLEAHHVHESEPLLLIYT